MNTPERVTPQEIYPRVKSGETLLVCAYDDEATCRNIHLEGAMFLKDFQMKLPELSKDQEMVFYCA